MPTRNALPKVHKFMQYDKLTFGARFLTVAPALAVPC